MRNLLALAAAGLIGFAGIGWYLGWYRFQTEATDTGRHISIDLNTPKIKEDVGRGREKLRDFLSSDDENPSPSNPTAAPSAVAPADYQRTQDGSGVIPARGSAPFQPAPPTGNNPPLLPTPR